MMCVLHIVISISISKCTTIVLFPLTLKTFWWINRKCHLILIMININLWVHSNDSSWTIFFSSLVVFSKYLSIHSFAHSFVLSQFSKCRLVICRHKKGRLTENHLHALWFISLCFFPLLSVFSISMAIYRIQINNRKQLLFNSIWFLFIFFHQIVRFNYTIDCLSGCKFEESFCSI